MKIAQAEPQDAERILEIQKLAYLSEARLYNNYSIAPLTETLAELLRDFTMKTIYKATMGNLIVGSIRGVSEQETCHIGRLSILPAHQNKGLGTKLIQTIEDAFCHCKRFELFTGHKSTKNIRLYERLGYNIYKTEAYDDHASIVYLEKFPTGALHGDGL